MKVIELIKNLKSKNILVIGDIMLDNYYIGESNRISPEAPVPILLEKDNYKRLGGAANVAFNLIGAGQKVSIMTVVGNDINGDIIIDMLNDYNIKTNLIVRDSTRPTTVKNRFIGQNNIQMFRFDQENSMPISEKINQQLFELYNENIEKFDLVIISDYNKGLLTIKNTPNFIDIANMHKIKVTIDIKEPNYQKYKNAFLIKPNLKELAEITHKKLNNFDDIFDACHDLQMNTNCKYVLVTKGSSGMSLFANNKIKNFKCESREVYDVTGAGDTVISYLSTCIANNYDLVDCIDIANYAAGVKVSKMGTYAVKPNDIITYIIEDNNSNIDDKIVTLEQLQQKLKNNDKKIVFTNGCFDIFHVGHLNYLKQSSKYGDIFIIGVNSDNSVQKIKGKNRPIVPQQERMELLASLSFITYVVLFDEETPYKLIKAIQPDIITKGGDYNSNDIIGKDIVEAKGGKVIICPLTENKSTTNIIKKIIEVYHE